MQHLASPAGHVAWMEILAALPQPKEPSSNIKRRFKGKKPPMLSTVPGKPHQMVLKFATAVPDAALPVEKAKVTRSRNGCFNCEYQCED